MDPTSLLFSKLPDYGVLSIITGLLFYQCFYLQRKLVCTIGDGQSQFVYDRNQI